MTMAAISLAIGRHGAHTSDHPANQRFSRPSSRHPRERDREKYAGSDGKTPAALRDVAAIDDIIGALDGHKTSMKKKRKARGEEFKDELGAA